MDCRFLKEEGRGVSTWCTMEDGTAVRLPLFNGKLAGQGAGLVPVPPVA